MGPVRWFYYTWFRASGRGGGAKGHTTCMNFYGYVGRTKGNGVHPLRTLVPFLRKRLFLGTSFRGSPMFCLFLRLLFSGEVISDNQSNFRVSLFDTNPFGCEFQ